MVPLISALEIFDNLPPLGSRFMISFILEKGHLLLVGQIGGVLICYRILLVEELHTLLNVGGIVVGPHGVMVDKIVLYQYIATMIVYNENHHPQHFVANHISISLSNVSS